MGRLGLTEILILAFIFLLLFGTTLTGPLQTLVDTRSTWWPLVATTEALAQPVFRAKSAMRVRTRSHSWRSAA